MSNSAPIGVFDSGMGGISVVRQIRADMPDENIVFYGDSAHAPYGLKSVEEIRGYCFAIVDRLLDMGAKAIVIACNTATSACVNDLRERYSVPIIGMEPALKVACDRGNGTPQHVIVAATPLTLRERKFARLMARFQNAHDIEKQPCPDLVTIVESGQLEDRDLVMRTLHKYFDHYDLEHVDSVVLGCTHFIFYRSYFREFLPSNVAIVDGNEGTSRHLHVVLESLGQLAPDPDDDKENASEPAGSAVQPKHGNVTLLNSSPDSKMVELERYLLDTPLYR
ncbi:MAG: glutamate racemase [Bifidobacteriaceae bacterium]|nr:glutamate racemase [Bifidobacteriaceae bacterium]